MSYFTNQSAYTTLSGDVTGHNQLREENKMQALITAVEAAWAVLKAEILKGEAELVVIFKQLWAIDTQIVMADLQKALQGVAIQLQNEQPGISSKDMFAQLLAAVTTQFASLAAQLVYADIMAVIAIVVKGTNAPETTGNAGTVTT